MVVSRVAADQVRSLAGVVLEPGPGVTVVIGPNGAGKTNLIEAIYFGLTTRSFRTSDRRDLIPFGSTWARVRIDVSGEGSGMTHRFMAAIDRSQGTRFTLDGAAVDRIEAAAYRPAVTVFSPDRLELVKGPPSVRRGHIDGFIGARWPGLAGARREFGRALAQRNALLTRLRDGIGDRAQLAAWDSQVARTGSSLATSREQAVDALADKWSETASELGLEGETALRYRPGGPVDADDLEAALEERQDSDIRTGRTGAGPHHDEIRLEYRGRQLRRFGSQGQQRIGLLALLFAEREVLLESGRSTPLMLLDDVMSELDADRRGRLIERLVTGGQSVITAAEGELVPEHAGVERIRIADLVARRSEPRGPGEPARSPANGSSGGSADSPGSPRDA